MRNLRKACHDHSNKRFLKLAQTSNCLGSLKLAQTSNCWPKLQNETRQVGRFDLFDAVVH